jgi:hypothetical protein
LAILQRKDVAGVSNSNKPEAPEEEESDGKGSREGADELSEGAFNSKSQVLNLFTIDVDR